MLYIVPGHNTVEAAQVDVGDHGQEVPVGVEVLDTPVRLGHEQYRLDWSRRFSIPFCAERRSSHWMLSQDESSDQVGRTAPSLSACSPGDS